MSLPVAVVVRNVVGAVGVYFGNRSLVPCALAAVPGLACIAAFERTARTVGPTPTILAASLADNVRETDEYSDSPRRQGCYDTNARSAVVVIVAQFSRWGGSVAACVLVDSGRRRRCDGCL